MLDLAGVCREGPGGGKEASRHLELHNHDCFNHLHSPDKYCDSIILSPTTIRFKWIYLGGGEVGLSLHLRKFVSTQRWCLICLFFLVPHLPGVGDEGRLLSDPSLHLGW